MPNNSDSVSLPDRSTPVQSGTPKGFPEDLEQLFENREQLLWLIILMGEYTSKLENVEAWCIRLLQYQHTCYLLDFDVILNFLEMKSLDKVETFAVDFLFFDSKVDYAIPIGAFEELLAYLSSLSEAGDYLSRVDGDGGPETVIRKISKLFRIRHAEDLPDDALMTEVLNRLEGSIIELSRLLLLLKSTRFEGVKATYDPKCYAAWFKAIRARERARFLGKPLLGKPRSQVDHRDAMNLSVASRKPGLIQSRAPLIKDTRAGYLLVSQTEAVVDLMRHAEGKPQFGELGSYFGIDPLFLKDVHPVVRPRDVMMVELLGGVSRPTDAVAKLGSLITSFRDTKNLLLNEYMLSAPNERRELYREAFGPFMEQGRRRICDALRPIYQNVLGSTGEMALVEEGRAILESEELCLRRQKGLRDRPEDELRSRSLQFKQLLSQIAHALESVSGADYKAEVAKPSDSIPFTRIQVGMHSSLDTAAEPLMSVELYPAKNQTDGSAIYEFYSVRWPISCLEEQLIGGLRDICPINGRPSQTRRVTLTTVDENHEYWKEGFVVSTSVGCYGMPLQTAAAQGAWKWLQLRALAPLVKEAVPKMRTQDGRILVPVVLQLRINTPYSDIIYDVKYNPAIRRRCLTVLSHYNLADQLAKLYKNTGTLFSMQGKLAQCLHGLFKSFRQTPFK